MVVGDRVALNRTVVMDSGIVGHEDEVGHVIGHQGDDIVVGLDHGQNRVVVCRPGGVRLVRVAHPGKPRRSKPRRTNDAVDLV